MYWSVTEGNSAYDSTSSSVTVWSLNSFLAASNSGSRLSAGLLAMGTSPAEALRFVVEFKVPGGLP